MNWPAKISVNRLLIAAASARPFVRAAAMAGYEVIAADVFCDEDTRRDAFAAVALRYSSGGFETETFLTDLAPYLSDGRTGFVYGSGFESHPELLDAIAEMCPVFGNSAATVRAIKDPSCFFSRLSVLDIPHPETSLKPPHGHGWLRKRVGGSGGTHVTDVAVTDVVVNEHAPCYFQRFLSGKPCALLFLADGQDVVEIGCHEQSLAPVPEMPFRFGGAVSQLDLPDDVRAGMHLAARKLTREFGLRGLNSLDCMVDGNTWWVLEINPRLSASFSLYDIDGSGSRLFKAHLEACQGQLGVPLEPESARAHLIYYSEKDRTIPAGFVWPEWVADVPVAGTQLRCGEPLCSIFASAETAAEAGLQVGRYADLLRQQLS